MRAFRNTKAPSGIHFQGVIPSVVTTRVTHTRRPRERRATRLHYEMECDPKIIDLMNGWPEEGGKSWTAFECVSLSTADPCSAALLTSYSSPSSSSSNPSPLTPPFPPPLTRLYLPTLCVRLINGTGTSRRARRLVLQI